MGQFLVKINTLSLQRRSDGIVTKCHDPRDEHGDIESLRLALQRIERGLVESQLEPRIAMVVFLRRHCRVWPP